jgi:hypothetical protein
MLSILNSLAEYFHLTNEALPIYDVDHDSVEQKHIYVIFERGKIRVYILYEEVIGQKIWAKYTGGIYWKKYLNIDEARAQTWKILRVNYYIEPAAKEYIQKFRVDKNKKVSTSSSLLNKKKRYWISLHIKNA